MERLTIDTGSEADDGFTDIESELACSAREACGGYAAFNCYLPSPATLVGRSPYQTGRWRAPGTR